MKKIHISFILLVLVIACGKDSNMPFEKKEIHFDLGLLQTKVTDSFFETGDVVSLWAVEHPHAEPVPLQIGGNYLNNEKIIFDGAVWTSSRPLYWSNMACDFYAVYPAFSTISSIEELSFSVATDQNAGYTSILDGYEASDLLYARTTGVSQNDGDVRLRFKHMLSKCTVNLIKGDNFEGEIPDDATVHIYSTTTDGFVNLGQGTIVKDSFGAKEIITCRKVSPTEFEAILIPQNIEKRTPFVEVTMGGIAYLLEYSLSLRPGYHHIINLTLKTSPDQEKIEIGIDAGIEGWV